VTVVTGIDVQPWCGKHRAMLAGAPRLTWDAGKQTWVVTLSDSVCLQARDQSECVTTWVCAVELEAKT
jgi:hypothetical protein